MSESAVYRTILPDSSADPNDPYGLHKQSRQSQGRNVPHSNVSNSAQHHGSNAGQFHASSGAQFHASGGASDGKKIDRRMADQLYDQDDEEPYDEQSYRIDMPPIQSKRAGNTSDGRASGSSSGRPNDAPGRRANETSSRQNEGAKPNSQQSYSSAIMGAMSGNKTLTYGLIVVIVILLVIVVMQILKSRKAAEDEKMANQQLQQAQQPQQAERQPLQDAKEQTMQHEHKQTRTATSMDDKLYAANQRKASSEMRQSMAGVQSAASVGEKAANGQRKTSAMGAHERKNAISDRRHLDTIVEESTTELDEEHEKTRATINELLKKEAQEDETALSSTGSVSVERADAEVRSELARRENRTREEQIAAVRDEAIVNPTTNDTRPNGDHVITIADPSAVDASSNGDDDENDDDGRKIVLQCNAILASGRRVGQECLRACVDGGDKCKQHINVKKGR